MKVTVGLLALCLALCNAHPGWKEGKEYIYDYEAKFGTGVADPVVTQFAGRGIRGKLHVYYKDDHLAVKFTDLKGAPFNTRLASVFEVLDLDYKTIPDLPEKVKEDISKPFWGVIRDGKIVGMKHTGAEIPEALNYKLSTLSLFQLIFPTELPHEHYYVVNETSIGGDCETTYMIAHVPNEANPKAEVLNVTKNHWFDRCSWRPHQFFSSANGHHCEHCKEEDFKSFKAVSRIDYELHGTKNEYTIEHIHSNGGISYTPFTTNGQTVMMLTNQTVLLSEIKDAAFPAIPGDAHEVEGLHAIMKSEHLDLDHVDLKVNHYYHSVNYLPLEKRIEKAEALLEKLTPDFADYNELARTVQKFGHIFQSFDYEDYVKFFSKNINLEEKATPVEKDRRNIVLKALSLGGTGPSVLYALELIETGKIPQKIAMEMLSAFPFYLRTPSLAFLERYATFAKSNYVNSDKSMPIFSVAWLAYGTLVYKSCVKDDFNPHPARHQTYVSHDKCMPFVQELINRIKSAKTNEDKCVYVRALKNTQTDEAFSFLVKEIIPAEKKYSTFIRLVAVWGLEHFVEDHHDDVLAAIVPILHDPMEDYQLRIYAFDILLYTEPHPVVFINLIHSINKEPCEKLASYVYSTMVTIANSTDPCYESIAKKARYIVPYIVNRGFDVIRHSTNRIFSFYNEKYGFGRTTQFIYIPSPDTVFPTDIYMRHAVNIGGYSFNAIEVGLNQRDEHAWDYVLAGLLQKYGLLNLEKGESFIRKHFDVKDIVKEGAHELYARIFNQDIFVNHGQLFWGDNPYITEISKNKYEIHLSKIISALQMEYKIFNDMGLPTMLSLHAPVIMKIEGTAELKKRTDRALEVELDIKYGCDADVNAEMEVITPLFGKYGYRLRTDAGIKFHFKGSISVDLGTHELKVTETVPEKPYEFLHYDTVPSTFIDDVELPVKYADKPIQRQYKWGHNYFGAGFRAEMTYDYYWNDYGSYRTFFKSFFHKSTRYEDYYDLIDRYFAGTRGFLDYAILNPTAKPFHLSVKYERATTNPTTEFVYGWDCHDSLYNDESKTAKDHLFRTRKFELHCEGKGTVERKWELGVEVDRHFPVNDYRKLNLHYKRSALPGFDDKTYEVCLNTETTVNGFEAIVRDPLKAKLPAEVHYKAVLKAGQDCGSAAKEITITGEGTPSEEHKAVDTQKLPMYQKCEQDHTKGYEFSYACWKVMKDQGRLGHYEFNIEYSPNVNPKVKDLIYRFYLWARHTFYNNLQIDRTDNPTITENHLKIVVNASYRHPVADVHVYRPHETVHYHNIFIPSVIPRYEPMTITEPFMSRYMRRVFNYHIPMCFLSGDYVYTLDGVQYKYPLGPCYHLAVGITGPESIALLFKSIVDGKFSKAMKLVVDKDILEIKPEGGVLTIYDNGKKILDDGKIIHKFTAADGKTVTGAVYKKLNGYVVDAPFHGMNVFFDGKNAIVKVTNLYRGHQHGLCGDFNGERHHEFVGIDGKVYPEAKEFAHSYAIHEDGCHA